MLRKIIIGAALAGTLAVGFGSGAAVAGAGSSRVRFESNDGRAIIVRDPSGAFLRAEDSATLRLVDYLGNGRAVYRVVIP